MKRLILILLFLTVFALPALGGFGQEKVDLNTATSKELEGLSGIGAVYAQRIIDSRPFSSVDDLIKVKGIGEKTLQKIKDQGLAYTKTETPNFSPEPKPNSAQPAVVQNFYSKGIEFVEINPSPEGSDTENEWIVTRKTPNLLACF